MTTPRAAPAPWSLRDAVVCYVVVSSGALAILGGWWGASATPLTERQEAWIAFAAGGLALALAGLGVWLLIGRRNFARRSARLEHRVRTLLVEEAADDPGPDLRPVSTAVMSRFHRPDCVLVRGKDAQVRARRSHERVGRTACEVCSP